MALVIIGKLISILPTQSGESARGRWVRGGFVIEHGEEYPRNAMFSLFGEDKMAQLNAIAPNTMVQVRFNPESREHEGRWYTDNRCISITPMQGVQYGYPQNNPSNAQTPQNPYGWSPNHQNAPQSANYAPNSGYQPQQPQQAGQMMNDTNADLPF